jgi:hypothetical protein
MKITAARRWGWTVALGAAASLWATGVWAQQEVARLKQVNGNVLVSGQAGLATGSEAQPLANGVRIITTANSRVVVVFENGCEVRMEENQRFDVESEKPCAALVPLALGAAPAVGQGLASILVPGLVGAASIAAITNSNSNSNPNPNPNPVSPN